MMKPQDDLAICRSVKYYKTPRKGARKCSQCGFFFIPDEQLYEKQSYAGGIESPSLTGVEWFAQFQCCPNCLPPTGVAIFGLRRCLGQRIHNGWTTKRGCNAFFEISSKRQAYNEYRNRIQNCRRCKFHISDVPRYAAKSGVQLLKSMKRPPSRKEWDSLITSPKSSTVIRWFGNWNLFIQALGATPRQRGSTMPHQGQFVRRFSDNAILKTMLCASDSLGHPLLIREWQQIGLTPTWSTIVKRFGSWSAAWNKIGLTILPHSVYGKQLALLNARRRAEYNQKLIDAIAYQSKKLAENEQKWNDHKFKKKNASPPSSDTPSQEYASEKAGLS